MTASQLRLYTRYNRGDFFKQDNYFAKFREMRVPESLRIKWVAAFSPDGEQLIFSISGQLKKSIFFRDNSRHPTILGKARTVT